MKKFCFTLLAMVMAIVANAAVEQLYLIGNPVEGGWGNGDKGTLMTKTADGVFEDDFSFSEDQYFAFATQIGTWDITNANRYSLEAGGDKTPSTDGSANTLVQAANAIKLGAGNWHFKVDMNELKFYVTASGEQPVIDYTYVLRGQILGDNWSINHDMEKNAEGKWTITRTFQSGDFGLERSDGSWIWSADKATISAVGTYACAIGGDGKNWTFNLSGDYTITFDPEAMTLTVSNEEQPAVEIIGFHMVGENYLADDDAYEFEEGENGSYSLNLKYGIYGSFKFVASLSNGGTRTFSNGKSGDDGLRLANEYDLSQSSDNMSLKYNTTSNVVVTLTPDEDGTSVHLSFVINGHDYDYNGITFYFVNTENWEHVYAYCWNTHGTIDGNQVTNNEWPGEKLTIKVTLPDGREAYEYNYTYGEDENVRQPFQNVIFNNGSGTQTEDLNARMGGIYTPDLTRKSDLDNVLPIYEPEAPETTKIVSVSDEDVTLSDKEISGSVSDKDVFAVVVDWDKESDHQVYYRVVSSLAAAPAAFENALASGDGFVSVGEGEVEIPVGEGNIELTTAIKGVRSAVDTYAYAVSKISTGVEEITIDAAAAAEYYNLQGVRVINPESGLYIRVQGNSVSKVYIR